MGSGDDTAQEAGTGVGTMTVDKTLVRQVGGAYSRCPECHDPYIVTGMELRIQMGKPGYWAYPQACVCGWRTPE